MQRLTIGEIVFVGLYHFRTLFGTYEEFISVLWNNFFYWQCSLVFMEQCLGNTYYNGSIND